MLTLLLTLLSPAYAVDGYQTAKWGMTVEQVQAAVPGLGECVSFSSSLQYCTPLTLLWATGEASYRFDDARRLYRVALVFDRTNREFVMEIGKMLDEKYGTATVIRNGPTVTSQWVTHGVEMKVDVTAGITSVRITYDAALSKSADAAKSAL